MFWLLILPIIAGIDYNAKSDYTVIITTDTKISADGKIALYYTAPTESQLKLKLAIAEAEKRMIENDKLLKEYCNKYGIRDTRILPASVRDGQLKAMQTDLIDKIIITPTEVLFK